MTRLGEASSPSGKNKVGTGQRSASEQTACCEKGTLAGRSVVSRKVPSPRSSRRSAGNELTSAGLVRSLVEQKASGRDSILTSVQSPQRPFDVGRRRHARAPHRVRRALTHVASKWVPDL